MTSRESAFPALAALTVATLLWGGSFIAMKVAMQGYSPLLVVFLRMGLASVVFAALLLPAKRRRLYAVARKDIPALAFMALCEPCLYFVFEAYALTLTQASQAAMITAMLPIMIGLAAAAFLKERLDQRTFLGLALAVVGVVAINAAAEPTPGASNPLLGNFLEFLAMVCAVGYIVTARHLAARYRPLLLTAVQGFAGALFFSPVLLFTPLPRHFPPGPTLAVVFLGLAVTFVAYGLYNFGVSRLTAAKAGAFINLIPVFACLLARYMLGEEMSAVQYAGGGLTLVGVAISAGIRRNQAASENQSARRE